MKSIRRTLILNVMVLLVLALGAVAALVYEITRNAIQEKQRTARQLVDLQFNEQRDEVMLGQARLLASEALSQLDPVRLGQYREASPYALYSLTFGPNSHVTTPLMLAERLPGSLSFRLNTLLATDIKFSDSDAMMHGYVQVNSDWGNIWRSQSLSGPMLHFDVADFSSEERFHWMFDDIEVAPGLKARRVRLKAPLARFRVGSQLLEQPPARASLGVASGLRRDPFHPERVVGPPWYYEPPRGPRVGRPSGGRPGNPPGLFGTNYMPTLYIQVAWDADVAANHPRMQEMEVRRVKQRNDLDEENREQLSVLKRRLIWIGAATLGIVLIGGWLLVGAGLAPLKRLSHAVSQISAKDFRLPLEPKVLPREVAPVAERLKQALQQLQEAFAREKRASADISHELRTPLAALTTTLEVALRKPRSNDDYRQTIEDSRQIARQISKLVERMLMLAWLDAGADEVRTQSVDIDELVEGCAAIGKPLAEAQGLRFQVRAEKPLTATTDPDKLREVVMNLVHNAIEYNRPGGEVEISASSQTSGIVVEVSDTGIGIPTELYDKIFERFYRGDPSRNAAGVHAGLGLAIVKEYVDRLGGRLSIESTVGTGSRFRIELPNA
jgi:heavy metal sensor kinase